MMLKNIFLNPPVPAIESPFRNVRRKAHQNTATGTIIPCRCSVNSYTKTCTRLSFHFAHINV